MNRLISRLGLAQKISLLTAVGLVIAIGLIAGLGFQALRENTERTILSRMVLSRMVARNIESILTPLAQEMRRSSARPVEPTLLRDNERDSMLQGILQRLGDLAQHTLIIDRNGTVLGSSPPLPQLVGASLASQPFLSEAFQTGGPSFSNAVPGLISPTPVLLLTAPLYNGEGKAVGLLAAILDLNRHPIMEVLASVREGISGHGHIIDSNGVILASTNAEEAFSTKEHRDFYIPLIRAGKGAVALTPSEPGANQQRHLMAFSPLPIAPWGVSIGESEEETFAHIRSLEERMLIFGSLAVAFTIFLVWIGMRAMVKPLQALTAAARRIAQGDLSTPFSLKRGDEIGILAQTFDEMREKLRTYRVGTERSQKELRTLLEASRDLTSSLDMDRLSRTILIKTLDLGHQADGGMLFLHDSRGERLVLRFAIGSNGRQRDPGLQNLAEAVALQAFQTHKAILCTTQEEILSLTETTGQTGTYPQSLACVPLLVKGEPIGSLLIYNVSRSGAFSPSILHLMEALAHQGAMALENARFYEEEHRKEELRGHLLQKVISAQEEERKRIARELHDEAGQALTALSISLETAEHSLPADPEAAKKIIGEMKSLTFHTLEDIHRIMIDLRPTLLDDLGLVPALRWYTQNYLEKIGIKANFETSGLAKRLSPQIETVVFRVIQEAITNIAKHSEARTATIRLEAVDSTLKASIEDDGKGFDVHGTLNSEDEWQGLGLHGMSERVSLLGGSFTIDSQPGQGTRLWLEIPIG